MAKLYSSKEEIEIHVKPITEEEVTEVKPQEKIQNKELFQDIKDIFENNKIVEREKKKYFTLGKGVVTFNLEHTSLMPNKLTLFNIRKFEECYYEQLESLIFTDKETIDPDNLLHIIILMDYITKNKYPIAIKCNSSKSLISKIVPVLNKFFNTHYSVLYSIFTMFNSHFDTEQNLRETKSE